MGILIITWNYPPRRGGMEHLLASLCEGLRKNHRVEVITAYAEGSAHWEVGIHRPRQPGLLIFFLFALWRGASLLRRDSAITIILGGSVLVTPIVVLLARLFRRKAVIQTHGLDLIYRNRIYQWLIVHWLRYADRVIANSRHTASMAMAKGVCADSISAIPPGVDCDRFQVAPSAEFLKSVRGLEGQKIILFVGRLARRKGVKEFIERSLVQIVKDVPEACFVIVGENPTESLAHHDDVAGEIRRTIAAVKLSNSVRWLTGVDDDELVQMYQLCDVLVLPVLEMNDDVEGFGIVALEAAAAGKPVVATRVGGIPDAIEESKSGILVAPGDYKSLSEAILSVLSDRSAASTMGEYGRRRVANYFAWRVVVARYEREFNRAAGTGHP
jgi:phosphatidylinositol alpha-1,6-mannosyltransferase